MDDDDDDGDNDGADGAGQTSSFFLFPLFRLSGISLDWMSCYIKASFVNIISTSADHGMHAVGRKKHHRLNLMNVYLNIW